MEDIINPEPVNLEERLFTVDQVAKYLGVGHMTIRRWIREGKISSIKLGVDAKSSVRIPEIEVKKIISIRKGKIIGDSVFD